MHAYLVDFSEGSVRSIPLLVDDYDCIDRVEIPLLLLHKHKPDKNGERKDQGGLGSSAVLHSR